ncbi:hypothetical protein CFC21_064775 [Triticum aestivum]|uniref:Uncharacterized protein n=3 Tax=Triticum TaxID=4564 RepID=A0A9R0WL90_TRITD|nr:hypothetical protein CFC21_064775 [Triticum aestivum]VAI14522.1 unnamed protein product [Triticum turgidum subsp. durum]
MAAGVPEVGGDEGATAFGAGGVAVADRLEQRKEGVRGMEGITPDRAGHRAEIGSSKWSQKRGKERDASPGRVDPGGAPMGAIARSGSPANEWR